jgi:hypothetical protein
LRQVECANPDKLRLFFLSLLWRAAATTLPEFSEISLEPAELERLRTMVWVGNPHPLNFFPTILYQIVSLGDRHNSIPIVKDYVGNNHLEMEVHFKSFRFYFDGLIAIMFREPNFAGGTSVVGPSSTISVLTQTWEHSFERINLIKLVQEATLQWPEAARKLIGNPNAARR